MAEQEEETYFYYTKAFFMFFYQIIKGILTIIYTIIAVLLRFLVNIFTCVGDNIFK